MLWAAVFCERGTMREGRARADVGFSKKCMGSGMSYRDTSAISIAFLMELQLL